MTESGKKDKRKKEQQKMAKHTLKEKRQLKKNKKSEGLRANAAMHP